MFVGILFIAMTALLFFPGAALAVQHHGGMEGLVSHEIGHVLFMAGLIMFLVWIRGYHEKGWPAFRSSLFLLLLWNVLTFSGHLLYEMQDGSGFIRDGGRTVAFHAGSAADLYLYLTRFDHVLLLPAMIFLFIALRQWSSASVVVKGPEMVPAPMRDDRGER